MVLDALDLDRKRLAWIGFGVLLAVLLAYAVVSFVGTFVFGLFIYYASRPIYRRVRTRVGPPTLAVFVSMFLVSLPILVLFAYALAIALQEFSAVANAANVERLESALAPYTNASAVVQGPEVLAEPNLGGTLQETIERALEYLGFLGNAALHIFVMFALAFYLLRDDHKLAAWAERNLADERGVLEAYATEVDSDLQTVFFGNILNALLTGALGAIAYTLLNVFFAPSAAVSIPHAALVGMLTGAGSLVPVVGMKIVWIPVALYMFGRAALAGSVDLLWFPVLFVAVSFFVVDVVPDFIVRPYVSGRSLHTGTVMFAYIFGPLLFGWPGIFIGPIVLICAVKFARIVLPELLARTPIEPYAVDPTYLSDAPPGGAPGDGPEH